MGNGCVDTAHPIHIAKAHQIQHPSIHHRSIQNQSIKHGKPPRSSSALCALFPPVPSDKLGRLDPSRFPVPDLRHSATRRVCAGRFVWKGNTLHNSSVSVFLSFCSRIQTTSLLQHTHTLSLSVYPSPSHNSSACVYPTTENTTQQHPIQSNNHFPPSQW